MIIGTCNVATLYLYFKMYLKMHWNAMCDEVLSLCIYSTGTSRSSWIELHHQECVCEIREMVPFFESNSEGNIPPTCNTRRCRSRMRDRCSAPREAKTIDVPLSQRKNHAKLWQNQLRGSVVSEKKVYQKDDCQLISHGYTTGCTSLVT